MKRAITRANLSRACAFVAAFGASVVACSTAPKADAGLELIIATDGLSAPSDFNHIALEISQQDDGGWDPLWDNKYLVPSQEATLPTTFTLLAGQTPREVLISVTAFNGNTPIVQRLAQVQVPTDRLADLWLILAKVCVGTVTLTGAEAEPVSTCDPGQSCQPTGPTAGQCASNVIPIDTLPTYMPGQDLDAGPPSSDATPSPDASLANDAARDDATTGLATRDAASETAAVEEADASTMDSTVTDAAPEGGSCTNVCTAGAIACASGAAAVQKCQMQANGCTQWGNTTTCGTHQTCSISGSSAACTCTSSICTQAGDACQNGQTLATCQTDGDGCVYVASTMACPSPQSCSGMAPSAACALMCTNSCTQGQTSCESEGLAKCTLGTNGCWAYGTPTACPSTRQTCSGQSGSAACTCNVDPTCRALGKTCASSSTLATCAQDSQSCFYEASSSSCSIGCHAGVCDVCSSGAQQCNGSTPQTCVNGQWQSGTACAGATPDCNAGVCGVCFDGAIQCSFNGVQTCTAGAWGSAVACPASTPACSAGICGQPPSCQTSTSGTTNCGASSESCCASLEVPAGTYNRTYTNSGSGATGEADPATLSGFRLDKYDVTVGRFRQFVTAWNGGAGWTPAQGSGKHTHLNSGQGLANSGNPGTYETGWVTSDTTNIAPTNSNLSDSTCDSTSAHAYATWTISAGSNDNLPINCENWFEAYAFCIWDGGFLPSEAEWEDAAAGGSQQREYPWGETDPGTANQYAIYDCYYPNGSGTCTGVASIAPVGTATLGAGLWGQLDLAGNVWQWNLDWGGTPYVDPCTDCAYLTAVSYREVQGGIFSGTTAGLMPPNRYDNGPTTRLNNVGFRCARTP